MMSILTKSQRVKVCHGLKLSPGYTCGQPRKSGASYDV